MTEQEEYETLKDTFNTQGWQLFIGYLEQDAEVLSNCRYIKDDKDLYFVRGKLSILDDLINFESKLDAIQDEKLGETSEASE